MPTLQDDTRPLWSWFARTGMGVHAGSRNIQWYQQHNFNVEQAISHLLRAHGQDDTSDLRVKNGELQALTHWTSAVNGRPMRLWIGIGTPDLIYRMADSMGRT